MYHMQVTDTPRRPRLTIIIPAYKEEATIGSSLESLAAFLRGSALPQTEVIVAVGRSSDNTAEVAASKADLFDSLAIIDDITPPSKGHNVQQAVRLARGDYCIYMDADLATPLYHLERMMELLETHDIVNAQRDIQTIHQGHRKFISIFGNLLVRFMLLPGFRDTQCGFKGFRYQAAQQIFARQRISSWGFDVELLAVARRRGLRVGHMPVPDWQHKDGGLLNEGPARAFRAAALTFVDLLRVRYYLAAGRYE